MKCLSTTIIALMMSVIMSVQAIAWDQWVIVVDEGGSPVIGAVVTNINTGKSVITDLSGDAKLEATNGNVISAEYIGCITNVAMADSDGTVKIKLDDQPLTHVDYYDDLIKNSVLVSLLGSAEVHKAYGNESSYKIWYDPESKTVNYGIFTPYTPTKEQARQWATTTMQETLNAIRNDGKSAYFIGQVKDSGISVLYGVYNLEGKSYYCFSFDADALVKIAQ